jgi:hypothetical protein
MASSVDDADSLAPAVADVSTLPFLLLSQLITHYDVGYFSVDTSAPALEKQLLLVCKVLLFPFYLIVGDFAKGDGNIWTRRLFISTLIYAITAAIYVILTQFWFSEHTSSLEALVWDIVLWLHTVSVAVVACA